MVNKPLIDVNVCLDLLLKRSPHMLNAARIFQASEKDRITGFVSATSFDTFFYFLESGFSAKRATDKLKTIASITSIATADSSVINVALASGWADIEDAIQYHSGLQSGCDAVLTRNPKDFKGADLPVLSPLEFMDRMNAQ